MNDAMPTLLSLLDTKERTPLTRLESEAFFRLSMFEGTSAENQAAMRKDIETHSAFLILMNRLDAVGVKTSLALQIWIASLCSTPGECMVWAFTLAQLYARRKAEVNMETWAFAFPDGLPTQTCYEQVWMAQKRGGANWFDTSAAWPTVKS